MKKKVLLILCVIVILRLIIIFVTKNDPVFYLSPRNFNGRGLLAAPSWLDFIIPLIIIALFPPKNFSFELDFRKLYDTLFPALLLISGTVITGTLLSNYIQKTKFDDDISHSESFSPGFLSQPATPDEKNIFTLEPGFKTGNLLHELLERLDFKHPQNIKNLIPGQLERFGFDREWENVIQDLMQRVATLQLKPGLNLKDIGSNERITEMEFYLPLKSLEPKTFQHLYQKWAFSFPHDFFQSVKDLDFQATHGFLKGYIDLVFTHENKFYLFPI